MKWLRLRIICRARRTSCVNPTEVPSALNKYRKSIHAGQKMTIVSLGQDAAYICCSHWGCFPATRRHQQHQSGSSGPRLTFGQRPRLFFFLFFFFWLLTFKRSQTGTIQIKNRARGGKKKQFWFKCVRRFLNCVGFFLFSYSYIWRNTNSACHTRYKIPTHEEVVGLLDQEEQRTNEFKILYSEVKVVIGHLKVATFSTLSDQ